MKLQSTGKSSDCPREPMTKIGQNWPKPLYIAIQAWLTWLTGRPSSGQQPIFRSTKELELVKAIVGLFGSALISAFICNSHDPFLFPLLIPSWLITTGSARKLIIYICHDLVHYIFFKNRRHNRWLAEILSTLLFSQGFDGYWRDHIIVHHDPRKFATFSSDVDAQFMLAVGLIPGLK